MTMPDPNVGRMRDQLIAFQRQAPFVPYVVVLYDGTVYRIKDVECMSVAKELWTVVGEDGVNRVHSFQSIQQIVASGGGDSYDA
jgi:hypothetical protein